MTTLAGLLDHVLAASAGPVEVQSDIRRARNFIRADVTVLVTGRRGAGKTTLVNELLGEPVLTPGYTAEDHPARLIASQLDEIPHWANGTLVTPQLAKGRRYAEIPEHLAMSAPDELALLSDLGPDLLVHVIRQRMHSDELDLLRNARRAWRLANLEILIVGEHSDALEGTKSDVGIRLRLRSHERLVVARRCAEVIQHFGALAARCDDRDWARRVVDDLEQLCLSSQGHQLRERWALETCLARSAHVPEELRGELVALTLGTHDARHEDGSTLLARAGYWRERLSLLPPLAAEVARVVVRTLQLRATATQEDPSTVEGTGT